MSRLFSLPGIGFILIVLAVVGAFYHPIAEEKANEHLSQFNPNGGVVAETFYFDDEVLLANWVESTHVAQMNVDVRVSVHAWDKHGIDATNAIRCLTNNGTSIVLSEKGSRNLHLICVDPKTGEAWVVIIERILRYANSLTNASSKLITAFKLADVTVEQYVQWETQVKSIVVRLSFLPGELFFQPK